MKKYLLLLLLCVPLIGKPQFGMDYQYVYNSPLAAMPTLNTSHGISMAMYAPLKKTNFSLGLSFKCGLYGYYTQPINFTDTEGNEVKTNLNVSNGFHMWSAYGRYTFNKFSPGKIIPFIDAGLGWAFFRTKIYIEDPDDVSNCEPLEQDIIQKDNSWNVYAGAGFDILLTGLFRPERAENPMKTYFNICMGYNIGGNVSYMNVDAGESAAVHHHGTGSNEEGKENFYTTWVNTTTQVVHEHHSGYLFTSPVRMLELKAGFSLRF